MNYLDIYTIQSQVYINIFLDNYKYKNNIYIYIYGYIESYYYEHIIIFELGSFNS